MESGDRVEYTKLGSEFDKLSKPAKRALLKSRIYRVEDLAMAVNVG